MPNFHLREYLSEEIRLVVVDHSAGWIFVYSLAQRRQRFCFDILLHEADDLLARVRQIRHTQTCAAKSLIVFALRMFKHRSALGLAVIPVWGYEAENLSDRLAVIFQE